MEDASPCGFNAGDTNLYRYVGDDPTNRLDPSGLEWLDADHRPVGYTYKPATLPKTDSNCLGGALVIDKDLSLSKFADEKYVPYGTREVPVDGITKLVSSGREGETELIVAWVIDKETKKAVFHAVGRDRNDTVLTWKSKLGTFIAGGEVPGKPGSLAYSGNYVQGISDFRAALSRKKLRAKIY